jgi:hypothetical protein
MAKKPILVTGSHRSGSTWVGKIIAASRDTGYIHEPFSVLSRPGICRVQFPYWFPYIFNENDYSIRNAFRDTLEFKFSLLAEFKACKNSKEYTKAIRDCVITTGYRISGVRPLVKDPLAFFSTEWLAEEFNMDVIVLIRHPAAFASSLKIKSWSFPFSDLLNQECLIETYLYDFLPSIEKYASEEQDIINQAILLWNIIHHTVLIYRQKHPEWFFIRHEDLSRNPTENFHKIFHYLGLQLSSPVKQAIVHTTSSKNQKETTANIHFVKRNSELNIWNWKDRLTPEEIRRVYEGVNSISENFYTEQDWFKQKTDVAHSSTQQI